MLAGKKTAKVVKPTGVLSTGQDADDILLNWRSLTSAIGSRTEDDLKVLMQFEAAHKNRDSFKVRLFGSFSELRTTRERKEYLGTH